jgi:type IV pilus assembly protein PilQ
MYCEMKSRGKTIMGMKLFLCAFLLIAVTASTVTATAAAGKPIQSFKFEAEFSIRSALAMLGSAYGKNIVPTPQVDGSLAFRELANVTFEEAMDAILGDNFPYEQVGNLIKVYTRDEYKKIMEDPARMEYKVFTLYYVTAAEAQNLITPLLSTAAQIQVTSPAETSISSGAGGSGGGGGSVGAGGGGTSSKGGGDTLALHDTIVIYDYPENIQAVRQLLDVIDVRPKQVLIEATILAARLNEGMELGVDWNLAAGAGIGGIGDIKIGQGLVTGTPAETTNFAGTQSGAGLRLGITTGDVRVFVTALESITDTTVLATPKIMTVNKQEGSVLIGTNLGYRSSTTIGSGGVATEGEVEFLQTGTQLVFRPYIGNDGYIRMEIYPKDSTAELNADGVPTEQTVEMKTNVIVKDGETIVIGGLFRNVITTTRNQVPLLGDLPWVGGLFRGTSDSNKREEVIVLLTTRIIDPPSGAEGDKNAEDARRKVEGAKDELQSISRTRMAEQAYEKAAKCYVEGDIEGARRQLKISLRLRPSYLEALRLKDKIDAEHPPIVVIDESMVEYEGTLEDEGMVIEDADSKDDPESWSKK